MKEINGQHDKYSVENVMRQGDTEKIKANLERLLLKLFCESKETTYKIKN